MFLQAEALKQYDDRRAEAKTAPAMTKPEAAAKQDADTAATDGTGPSRGWHDGRRLTGVKTAEDEKKKMLPVTTFGRYIKVLLSSNEFLFVS